MLYSREYSEASFGRYEETKLHPSCQYILHATVRNSVRLSTLNIFAQILGVQMNDIQNEKKKLSRKVIVINVTGLCHQKGKLWKFFFHVWLRWMRRHISAIMLRIIWTERWIGRSGPIAWPPRSPDLTPLDIFLWSYVQNIVYQVKINDLQHLKARIRDAVAMVTPNMAQAKWNEVEYCLDIFHATKGTHIEIYYNYIHRKKLR
jgi:hypothetical protein